ncbi:hypothetical protein ED733_004067 [Metarhizium rileyi]|uniref:Uncharacterized protein n=1 Tax=Metarhizium rileyi (strain RCEF 4871) TaxID=1649241 RepID=A0A5C6GA71_METRR|nr:hypothetical protein ED733_004067 [Metarhizium rileyi]
MSRQSQRLAQIDDRLRELDGIIQDLHERENQVQGMLNLIAGVPIVDQAQVSRSASSSTRCRARGEVVGIQERKASYENTIVEIREAIHRYCLELNALQQEKWTLAQR